MRFGFIRDHAEEFPVDRMCHVLHVSRSGYYAWRQRPPSAQAQRRAELVGRIRQVHAASRKNYGSPRVWFELDAQGVRCSKNTVAKLMRQNGIRAQTKRRFVVRTTDSRHGHPVAENRLNRQFHRPLPNQAWAADISVPQKRRERWEIWPPAIGLQEQVANHRKRLGSKALVVSVAEKVPSGIR